MSERLMPVNMTKQVERDSLHVAMQVVNAHAVNPNVEPLVVAAQVVWAFAVAQSLEPESCVQALANIVQSYKERIGQLPDEWLNWPYDIPRSPEDPPQDR